MDHIADIKALIAQDRVEEALETLANRYPESDCLRDILLLKSRYKALQKKNNQGIVSYEDATLEKNKLVKALLELIAEMEQAEAAPPAQRWWRTQASRYRFLLLALVLLAVAAGGFAYYKQASQQSNQEQIQLLDEEIATRIQRIDIRSWYRIALLKDSAIDLQKRLLLQPGRTMAIHEQFEERNLRSLLLELKDRVEAPESEKIERALQKLQDIEVTYGDGLLSSSNNPGLILKFGRDLFDLNAYRWVEHNQMDEEQYEALLQSLNGILQEVLSE